MNDPLIEKQLKYLDSMLQSIELYPGSIIEYQQEHPEGKVTSISTHLRQRYIIIRHSIRGVDREDFYVDKQSIHKDADYRGICALVRFQLYSTLTGLAHDDNWMGIPVKIIKPK